MTQLRPLFDWLSGSPVTEMSRPSFASQITPHPQPQKRQTARVFVVSLPLSCSGVLLQALKPTVEPVAAALASAIALALTNSAKLLRRHAYTDINRRIW